MASLLLSILLIAYLTAGLLVSPSQSQDFLLVTWIGNNTGIYKVLVSDGSWHKLPISADIGDPSAITYDPANDTVIWSDSTRNIIASASMDGRNYRVLTSFTNSVEGLVFDPSSRLLFWTHEVPGYVTVKAVDQPDHEAEIVSSGHGYTGIALLPNERSLYFTNQGSENKIEWMTYTGEGRSLFYNTRLQAPQALAYDESTKRLFACDNDVVIGKATLLEITTPGGALVKTHTWPDFVECRHMTVNKTHVIIANTLERELMIIDRNNFSSFLVIGVAGEGNMAAGAPTAVYYYNSSATIPQNPCTPKVCHNDQFCIPTSPGSWTCRCKRGATCGVTTTAPLPVAPQDDILFMTWIQSPSNQGIWMLKPESGVWEKLRTETISFALAVGFDPVDNLVYWSDQGNQWIASCRLDGTGFSILANFSGRVEGLYVEPNSRLLYYSDIEENAIVAVDLDSGKETVVVGDGLGAPRDLEIDYTDGGWLYWGDWGAVPQVERSRLDGSEREVFYKEPGAHMINGIHVHGGSLYLCDVQGTTAGDKKAVYVEVSTSTKGVIKSSMDQGGHCYHLEGNSTSLLVSDLEDGMLSAPVTAMNTGIRIPGQPRYGKAAGLFYHEGGPFIPENPCASAQCSSNEICLPSGRGFVCRCFRGKTGLACSDAVPRRITPSVMSSTADSLHLIVGDPNNWVKTEHASVLELSKGSDYSVFDLDIKKQLVYYYAEDDEAIYLVNLTLADGEDHKTTVLSNVDDCRGIAYDWKNNVLYYTKAAGSRGVYKVDLSTGNSNIIVSSNVRTPRGIAVDPFDRKLYWCDEGRGRVETCDLDGSNRRALSTLYNARDVTLDYSNNMLYVIDDDNIYNMTKDGSVRLRVKYEALGYTTAVDVSQDYIFVGYYHIFSSHYVRVYNKSTGVAIFQVRRGDDIHDIRYNHPDRQPDQYVAPTTFPTTIRAPSVPIVTTSDSFLLMGWLNSPTSSDNGVWIYAPSSGQWQQIPLSVEFPLAVAYDAVENRVYWSDKDNLWIASANIDGSGFRVITNYTGTVEGMYVEPNSRLLYYSDIEENVIVARHLVTGDESIVVGGFLGAPRDISIDFKEGWMYWADWGSYPRVERARLDGSRRSIMYMDPESYLTNGVHVYNGTLYLCEVQGERRIDLRTVYVEVSTSTRRTLKTVIDRGANCYHIEGNETSLFISDLNDNLQVAPLHTPNRSTRVPGQPRGGDISAIFYHDGVEATQASPCADVTCGPNKMCLPSGTSISCQCLRGKTGSDCSQTVGRRTTPSVVSSTSDSLHFVVGDPNNWVKTRRASTFELSSHGSYSYFDIDVKNQTVYYYRRSDSAIYTNKINGSDTDRVLVAINVGDCRGIAYDWKNHALFYTRRFTMKGIYKVDLVANTSRRIVSSGVISPRGIAVDPFRGQIYWCDSGSDKLEVADLNGSNRRPLLTNFFSARDIAIDYESHVLYAVDLDAIYRISLDGGNKTRIAYEADGYTRAIDIDDNYIFIAYGTLLGTNYVKLYDKDTGSTTGMNIRRGSSVTDVRVNSMQRQPDSYTIPSTVATTRGPTTLRPSRTSLAPRSTTSFSGSCGGQLSGSGGRVTSPNYPSNYPPNANCIWTITAPLGQRVRLTFTAFRLEGTSSTTCTFDYLTVYTNSTSSGRRFCGSAVPPTTSSRANVMHLTLVTDGSVSYTGFSASWIAVVSTDPPPTPPCGGQLRGSSGRFTSPNYPWNYPNDANCTWTIIVPLGQQVQLSFTSFMLEGVGLRSSTCSYDYLTVDIGATWSSRRFCGSTRPPTMRSGGNMMRLTLVTDGSFSYMGFSASWVAVGFTDPLPTQPCGGPLRGSSGRVTSPNYPADYPNNANCTWIIDVPLGQHVRLSFTAFRLEDTDLSSFTCTYDYLDVYKSTTSSGRRFCGRTRPPTTSSRGNVMRLTFVSDGSDTFMGFSASWVAVRTTLPPATPSVTPLTPTAVPNDSCGGQLRGSSGHVSSPNHPRYYPDDISCNWTITVPVGQRVRLTFTTFRLERASNCSYDYLAVYTSPTSRGRKFCGSTVPPTTTSSGNFMRLALVTDRSVSYTGFSASWIAVGSTLPPTSPTTTLTPLTGDFLLLALKTSSTTAEIWTYYVSSAYWRRLPLSGIQDARGVGWDPANSRVFWSDVDGAHIMSANIDGSDLKLETNVTGLVDGLYVEPSSRLLFFTNANGGTITARHLTKGTQSEVLDHDIGAPRGLAVDFTSRWLYWADWGGSPRIEKAQLDGSRKTTLHQEQNSDYTNGIHLDQASNRLFFCDNKEHGDEFHMNLVEISPVSGDVRRRNVFDGYFCMHLSGNFTHLFVSDLLKGVHVTPLDSLDRLTPLQRVPPATAYYAIFYVSESAPLPGPDPCTSTRCTSNKQMCIPAQNGNTCVCQAGWTGPQCLTKEDYDAYPAIVSSTKDDFEYIVGDPAHWIKTLSASIHRITSGAHQLRYAFDFNVEQKLMYYCVDFNSEFIVKSKDVSVQGSTPITVASQLSGCGGLAYNWKNRDLYVTSSGTEAGISRIDSMHKTSTKLVSGNMEQPAGIAVDPFKEHIYWCDAGLGRVERVNINGQNRVTLANLTGVTDVVIDFNSTKLYLSAGSSVYWIERDGSHLAEFAEEPGEQVVALTLSQNYVFLGTQHSAGSYINVYDKTTGAVARHLQRAGKMTDIGFYSAARQPATEKEQQVPARVQRASAHFREPQVIGGHAWGSKVFLGGGEG